MPRLRRTPAFVVDQTKVLAESAAAFGRDGRRRYAALLKQSLKDLASDPKRAGVKEVPGRPGAFSYPMRYSHDAMPEDMRVKRARHVIFFRIVDEGRGIQLLRLLHDRMLPTLVSN